MPTKKKTTTKTSTPATYKVNSSALASGEQETYDEALAALTGEYQPSGYLESHTIAAMAMNIVRQQRLWAAEVDEGVSGYVGEDDNAPGGVGGVGTSLRSLGASLLREHDALLKRLNKQQSIRRSRAIHASRPSLSEQLATERGQEHT